jgi:exonuclease III
LDTGNEDGFKGVDVWRYLRGDERKYTYYPRNREWGSSCDRVDLVVSSNRLVADRGIVDAEIWSTEKERGPSDHVPLSVHVRLVDEKHKRLKEEA